MDGASIFKDGVRSDYNSLAGFCNSVVLSKGLRASGSQNDSSSAKS